MAQRRTTARARIKSPQEIADETEFSRRQNMSPYIQVRRMPGHNSYDVVLTLGTTTVGSKTERLRGGKVVSAHYFLPRIEPIESELREYMSRPVSRSRDPQTRRSRDGVNAISVLGRVDRHLSNAQDELGRHLINLETKGTRAYEIAEAAWSHIERLRHELNRVVRRL